MPMTVPTAAPVSIPPCMAEAITSSSAAQRPTDTRPNSSIRPTAISTQAAEMSSAELWRSSSVSLLRGAVESASRKK